jgi:cytochrome c553
MRRLIALCTLLCSATLVAQEGEEAAPAAPGLTFEQKLATCAACHGQDGNKPTVAEYPKLGGQYKSYLAHALRSYKVGRRENLIMTQQMQALSLTEEDIERLAEYYESQGGLKQIENKD